MSESRFYKQWQTLAIIREISDCNLETEKTVQNLESPGLSGTVDSPAKLSFCIIMPYFFFVMLCSYINIIGKNKNEKLALHLCDVVITLIVIGIILLFWFCIKLQTMNFVMEASSKCICNYLNFFFFLLLTQIFFL